jgi:hypothetical protein
VDRLFTSPRDGSKYAVRYGVAASPEGMASEALAWEQSGEKGKRFVALTVGHVEEYAEEEFNPLKKAGSRNEHRHKTLLFSLFCLIGLSLDRPLQEVAGRRSR